MEDPRNMPGKSATKRVLRAGMRLLAALGVFVYGPLVEVASEGGNG